MKYQYQTLKVEQFNEGTIIRVTLYRPKKRNAMNLTLFQEIGNLFKKLNSHQTARVVIVDGDGPVFTSGLDTKQMGFIFSLADKQDAARNAVSIYSGIKQKFQDHILSIYQCRLPVIMGTHKLCIGLGVDFICSADIRYCTKDCIFAIRQIQLGLATDVGTLQFFPKITGNSSAFKELAYTGRDFYSEEAQRIGFVSKVFETKQQLSKGLFQTAKFIASKSPIGINVNKSVIIDGEKQILDNLQYVARVNSVMLQTQDTFQAFNAYTQKRKTVFPRL